MTEYWHAPQEVADLAQRIIDAHHDDLHGVDIAYLMRRPTAKRAGKEVWGKASKVSAKQRALADSETLAFTIELAAEVWDELTPQQKEALLDHELCHCGVEIDDEGEVTYVMRAHDLEEFGEIVARHGHWTDGVRDFAEQLELFKPRHLRAVGGE